MNRHQGIVKEFFDANFHEVKKIEDLSNARHIYSQLLIKQRDVEHQLSVITTEVPTKIEGAIRLADTSLSHGEALIAKKDELVRKITQAMDKCQPICNELGGMVVQVKEIEKFIVYLQWLEHIEELSGEVQQCILSASLSGASETYRRLIKVYETLTSQHSKCDSLLKFTADTILFWHRILKEKLAAQLEDLLKVINWPFILAPGPRNIPKFMPGPSGETGSSKGGTSASNSTDLSADFERIFTNLLLIQLPDNLSDKQAGASAGSEQSQPLGGNILLPLQLMLRPLKTRFRYHFSGKKQTNSIAKPEWYLTQILNWVGNHRDFLEHSVQPLLDNKGHKNIDVLVSFTRGLLQLVCRKLSEDMNELLYNDDMFSHTIDEVLLFDRELRGSHDFSTLDFKNENPMNMFMSPECLQKWISVEKACALDRLDAMLSSPKAWESQYGEQSQYTDSSNVTMSDDNSDDAMVPECAESFVTMLLTITDRYKYIPSPTYQLRFLELQLHLLDDFRIRLTQVLKNESSDDPLGNKHFAVINAAHYVANVLREWAENSFFLELSHQNDEDTNMDTASGSNDVVPQSLLNLGERRASRSAHPTNLAADHSVFDGMLRLYDRLHQDGLEQVSKMVSSEFENKGWSYVRESWLTLPPKEDQLTLVVSRTACSMLLVLQERLHLLSQRLSSQLFLSCWLQVAEKVDSFLFHEVVLRNRFNVGGAAQLEFDMTRNLFPLFSTYTRKPESFFRRMKESCILLNLNIGTAKLLSEVLNASDEIGDDDPNAMAVNPKATLSDLGVSLLQPTDAITILRLRIDWPQNM